MFYLVQKSIQGLSLATLDKYLVKVAKKIGVDIYMN